MANDRMWIQCEKCGDKLLLAKNWGHLGWQVFEGTDQKQLLKEVESCVDTRSKVQLIDDAFDVATRLQKWLEGHYHDDPTSTAFRLGYESRDGR